MEISECACSQWKLDKTHDFKKLLKVHWNF